MPWSRPCYAFRMNGRASGKGPSSRRVTLLVPNGSVTRINNNCLHCSFPGSSTAVAANISSVTQQLCTGQRSPQHAVQALCCAGGLGAEGCRLRPATAPSTCCSPSPRSSAGLYRPTVSQQWLQARRAEAERLNCQ